MKKILIIPVLLLLVGSACNSKNESMSAVMVADSVATDEMAVNMEMALPEPVAQTKFVPPIVKEETNKNAEVDKKIIKEGEIRFRTADVAETRKAIYTSLKKLGGYAAEEQELNSSYNGEKQITIHARVPAKNFDQLLTNVSENAESIDSKNIRIKDVTTEYIDVTTRLANKKKLEERYLELLKKGSKISDLLEIENKLTDIRSDIESSQGQLNYMMKQVAYSTIDITFYSQQTAQDNGQTFGYKIKRALTGGWHTLGSLFFGFIEWWPIWLIVAGLVYLLKRWRKKRRAEK
jgi:hypothetical protein